MPQKTYRSVSGQILSFALNARADCILLLIMAVGAKKKGGINFMTHHPPLFFRNENLSGQFLLLLFT
ncbi:MAG: hypothetical protein ACJAWT_001644 [Glaciecola sp.]|jgi:hypothetical protein